MEHLAALDSTIRLGNFLPNDHLACFVVDLVAQDEQPDRLIIEDEINKTAKGGGSIKMSQILALKRLVFGSFTGQPCCSFGTQMVKHPLL